MLNRNVDKYDAVKKVFPEILRKCLGNLTHACKELNVSREWVYRIMREDEKFKAACDEAHEVVVDFVESRLLNQIKNDNTAATIFFLKTRARHRGYIERTELVPSRASDDAIDVSPTKEQRDEIVRLCNEPTTD